MYCVFAGLSTGVGTVEDNEAQAQAQAQAQAPAPNEHSRASSNVQYSTMIQILSGRAELPTLLACKCLQSDGDLVSRVASKYSTGHVHMLRLGIHIAIYPSASDEHRH